MTVDTASSSGADNTHRQLKTAYAARRYTADDNNDEGEWCRARLHHSSAYGSGRKHHVTASRLRSASSRR